MQDSRAINSRHVLKTQSRFTFIKTVAMLVILGALAIFTIPKFVYAQDMAMKISIEKAVAELNMKVAGLYFYNLLKNKEGEIYMGYTGNLGSDFEITGQKANKPGSGTIKLANSTEVYTLIWTKKPAKNTHGIFSLGPKI